MFKYVVAGTRRSCAGPSKSPENVNMVTSVSLHTASTSYATWSDTPSTRQSFAAPSTLLASVPTGLAATSSTTPRRPVCRWRADPVLCACCPPAPGLLQKPLRHHPVWAVFRHHRPPPLPPPTQLSPSARWALVRALHLHQVLQTPGCLFSIASVTPTARFPSSSQVNSSHRHLPSPPLTYSLQSTYIL